MITRRSNTILTNHQLSDMILNVRGLGMNGSKDVLGDGLKRAMMARAVVCRAAESYR
jgi:hypothetical protein